MKHAITVELEVEIQNQIIKVAKSRNLTNAEIVREALKRYFKDEENQKATFTSLAADLIGVYDGPDDLSFNSDYMKDYGK